jgi:TrfA protein
MALKSISEALRIVENIRDKMSIDKEIKNSTNIVQLPLWPELTRGVPNGVLRSALFGVIKKGARRYMERERISAIEGIEIRYTGARLDQGDLDVWETVLHIARLQNLGNECRVTAYHILKILGKTDTGVDVQIKNYGYEGTLIEEVYRDKENREYVIKINKKLRALFEKDQWTAIDWAVRHELNGQPLAQWLHGFYSSHAKPYPYNISKLYELCGSENKSIRGFKQEIKKALLTVKKASEKNGQNFEYTILGDRVNVDREPSETQRWHLIKKATKMLS